MTVKSAVPRLRDGLAYFWIFNDRCDWDELEPQLEAFAAAGGVAAVCLHPRAGLLLPYGGVDWFDFIRKVCLRAAELDVPVWLYDEDPFPSGNAGGRLISENPGLLARGLRIYSYDPGQQVDTSLFCFPAGNLVWCGLVDDATGRTVDMTGRVGILRRRWILSEGGDSRYFYPDTPIYHTTTADTRDPELAAKVPFIPDGMRLVAIVARPGICAEWGPFGQNMDTLNPESSRLFIKSTHEKYFSSVGEMFGREIPAIFTDEAKFFDPYPWTPGLFENFARDMGYDIKPRLHYLFSDSTLDIARLTRLHYRSYVSEQFLEAWLRPVAGWCREHNIKLVGHMSPEDDPVEQVAFLGNAFPVLKEFDLCGLDLIIPAVGDSRHPILSVGVTCATSVAQQRNKEGVMSETGACAPGISSEEIGRIILWQAMMGVTSTVMHCAYGSTRGPREYDYPPNYGPNGALWPGMVGLHPKLAEVQRVTRAARQVAPVAIIWPIRSFCADKFELQRDHTGMRGELFALLAACLDRQVGTHFIDEADILELKLKDGLAVLGKARYSHILIPSCTVLHVDTLAALRRLSGKGIRVVRAGRGPERVQASSRMQDPGILDWAPQMPMEKAIGGLPRLIEVEGDATDIRCTAWIASGAKAPVRLLMNLRPTIFEAVFGRNRITLNPGEVKEQ